MVRADGSLSSFCVILPRTCATTNIEDNLALENVLVAIDEVTVSISANRILQHSLVDV